MIGLSDNQLEIIMSEAEPLADETCQEFLERTAAAVAAALQVRGQINDDDVSAAVRLALRGLIENSAAWKNWNATRQDGQFDARLSAPGHGVPGACCPGPQNSGNGRIVSESFKCANLMNLSGILGVSVCWIATAARQMVRGTREYAVDLQQIRDALVQSGYPSSISRLKHLAYTAARLGR
jgi:hypothetical protein